MYPNKLSKNSVQQNSFSTSQNFMNIWVRFGLWLSLPSGSVGKPFTSSSFEVSLRRSLVGLSGSQTLLRCSICELNPDPENCQFSNHIASQLLMLPKMSRTSVMVKLQLRSLTSFWTEWRNVKKEVVSNPWSLNDARSPWFLKVKVCTDFGGAVKSLCVKDSS